MTSRRGRGGVRSRRYRPRQTLLPGLRRLRLALRRRHRHVALAAILVAAVVVVAALGGFVGRRGGMPPAQPYDPGRSFTVDTDLLGRSGLTASRIDEYLAGHTELPPLGDAFVAAEQTYDVNALYLVAHAVHETGRGTSEIARDDHNLFGWNAYDEDPLGLAARFPDFPSGINFVARQIRQLYLDPGGRWWGGAATLRAMNVHYATDPDWASKIAGLANEVRLSSGLARYPAGSGGSL